MSPVTRITSILAALDELREPGWFGDRGPSGLHVRGGEEGRCVGNGV